MCPRSCRDRAGESVAGRATGGVDGANRPGDPGGLGQLDPLTGRLAVRGRQAAGRGHPGLRRGERGDAEHLRRARRAQLQLRGRDILPRAGRRRERTNRRLVDHTAHFNLAYTEHARRNLLAEGLQPRRIPVTGSPMPEVLEAQAEDIAASTALEVRARPASTSWRRRTAKRTWTPPSGRASCWRA